MAQPREEKDSKSTNGETSGEATVHLPILTTDALIFPSWQTGNINHATRLLRKSGLSISNRLRSIVTDARYVADVQRRLELPLVANERCGSWYIPPRTSLSCVPGGSGSIGPWKSGSAYFKSTDGHHGCWAFSMRRLNLDLLHLIGQNNGCIIVDSTRRGKHFPDALSKTVPIWCSVFNALIFPEQYGREEHCRLRVPREIISESEYSQIASRIDEFVAQAKEQLNLNWSILAQQVKWPLYPIWVARALHDFDDLEDSARNLPKMVQPVYLCMASEYKASALEESDSCYVQGAGDDNESWSCGLTPPVFWANTDLLLAASEDNLPSLIGGLVQKHEDSSDAPDLVPVIPSRRILVGTTGSLHSMQFVGPNDLIVVCSLEPDLPSIIASKVQMIRLKCSAGKLGSRDLRTQLDQLPTSFRSLKSVENVYICCPTGKDLCIGIALAIWCLYYDESGDPNEQLSDLVMDKMFIRKRLSRIMSHMPSASPSRATLNAVNAFLMKGPV